jgi:uridine phosphorylase
VSILNAFDGASEEILKPGHLAKRIENFPKTAIVTFNDSYIDMIKERQGAKIISIMSGSRVPIYRIGHKDKQLAVYQTMIGGAATVGYMEMMIAKGTEVFVFFGSCGTLDADISSGNLIVPTEAYRDEGTSYHYLSAETGSYVGVKTAEKLSRIMDVLKLPHAKAKTWTTDAIFRETRSNMEKRKAEGCLTVEMECASVMAAGLFRGVEVYQFLYAEDNLDSDEWERRSMGSVTKNTRERYLNIALDIACMV